MVQITDLPEEIVVMIVRRLDSRSQCSMYNSCKFFRNILSLHGVVLECNMSMSLLSTVNTMKLFFFKAISNHLLVLNMRGVPDLSKTKVLPAFKKLKRLKVLDISYTNLNISDLMAIHSVCPTLKDITVNFVFGRSAIVHLTEETLQQYQSLFEHFESVHFVGSLNNLLFSKIVFYILKETKLDTLKFSAVEADNVHTTVMEKYSNCQIPHFNHFAAYLINWKTTRTYHHLSNFPVISMIELKNYEYFIIYALNVHAISVYATPIFKKFFSVHFNVDVECVTDYKRNLIGNVALMIWNKETTQFNDIFFYKLCGHVKPYFPFFYEALSNISCPKSYDWIYTEPKAPDEVTSIDEDDDYQVREKKRKSAILSLELDFDNLLKDKLKAQLTLAFKSPKTTAVTIPMNGDYFNKITFLSLSGGAVNYGSGFFNSVFSCFQNLVTLSVECPSIGACGYYYDVCRGIQVSRTMKNLRLIDKGMEFKTVFDLLSKCETLENIHLVDQRLWNHSQISDPTLLIEACEKLHSVFIEAPLAETAQTKQLQWFNKVKTSCKRPYLRVVINRVSINSTDNRNSFYYNQFKYNYDPFLDVFQLNPIKPI